jgi:hypothetical protein
LFEPLDMQPTDSGHGVLQDLTFQAQAKNRFHEIEISEHRQLGVRLECGGWRKPPPYVFSALSCLTYCFGIVGTVGTFRPISLAIEPI